MGFVFWLWFFFFKQKTAYEMRISDWSSYVCASDLARIKGDGRRDRGARPQYFGDGHARRKRRAARNRRGDRGHFAAQRQNSDQGHLEHRTPGRIPVQNAHLSRDARPAAVAHRGRRCRTAAPKTAAGLRRPFSPPPENP